MAEIALTKVAMALGFGLLLAVVLGFVLTRLAEGRGGKGVFRAFFLTLVCVYALGFAARYVLVEILP
jgi:FtsH-binding integral membrane protein